jgi:c-di-GMP-related signal transduction protein
LFHDCAFELLFKESNQNRYSDGLHKPRNHQAVDVFYSMPKQGVRPTIV